MAKAKKSESAEKKEPATKDTTAKKAAPAKKAATKKPATSAAGGQPLVDTGLAAQNAAKLLVAGLPTKAAGSAGGPKSESSLFKSLKQGLAKPHLSGLDSVLDKSGGPNTQRPNLPFGGKKQTGHNQTFGADVNKAGVPRRTPG
jgi:hypothetical protein